MRAGLLLAAGLAVMFGFLPAAHAGQRPWEKDQALLTETENAVQAGGILAVGPHAEAMEQALNRAKPVLKTEGTTYVLTDGMSEMFAGMLTVTKDEKKSGSGNKAAAVSNPYPAIALYLASYYDEKGKPANALRVLDKGLASFVVPSLAEHRPYLMAERGAALNALKRWDLALDNYDDGLRTKNLAPGIHAIMLRGRGFSLTELGRLDEAEAAYKASLKLQPHNPVAENELKYIARLRAGGAKEPSGFKSLQPKAGKGG